MNLSYRAQILLRIVDAATEMDWTTGELHKYFVPTADPVVLDGDRVYVGGGGDAAIFRSLAKSALIERPRGCASSNPYCYAITEQGRIALSHLDV